MELPKVYTNKKVSPVGQVNKKDIKKIARDALIFFAAPILIYLFQLQGTLDATGFIVKFVDLVPTPQTIGAIEGWAFGVLINTFLKFRDGTK